uniref:Uncharacterized protein n=1 Tax=viral metagenome TaxID=1070528 RepID=A0A6C0EGJ6_9ZZZZ
MLTFRMKIKIFVVYLNFLMKNAHLILTSI